MASNSTRRLKDVDATIGTTIRVSAKDYERREQKQLDTKDLSEDGIESLKNTDLFMLYSIPKVRRAAMHLKDITLQRIEEACPKRGPVLRRTCISAEAHPSAMLMDLLDEDLDVATSDEMI